MKRAKIHTMRPKTEPSLSSLEGGDDNLYRILKGCKDILLLLDDAQLGRVMRAVIANDGTYTFQSREEDEAFAAILIGTLWESD